MRQGASKQQHAANAEEATLLRTARRGTFPVFGSVPGVSTELPPKLSGLPQEAGLASLESGSGAAKYKMFPHRRVSVFGTAPRVFTQLTPNCFFGGLCSDQSQAAAQKAMTTRFDEHEAVLLKLSQYNLLESSI